MFFKAMTRFQIQIDGLSVNLHMKHTKFIAFKIIAEKNEERPA